MSPKHKPLDYFEVAYDNHKHGCSVTTLDDRELALAIKAGTSVAAKWPASVTFSMNPQRPKDTVLTDSIPNGDGFLLASPQLTAFLREQSLVDVEFLPIAIRDHRKKIASKEYVLVQSHRVVDCVDAKRSDKKKLLLDPAALGEHDRLIRPKSAAHKLFVRADLKDALDSQNFSGLGFSRQVFGDFKVYRRPRI